jgi:hypothetical protein
MLTKFVSTGKQRTSEQREKAMSDMALTVLIVAVAVIIGLFMFRGQLRRFFLRANRKGLPCWKLVSQAPQLEE